MYLERHLIALLFYLHFLINWCNPERVTYFSTEYPAVYYYDKNAFKNYTLLSKRFNRQDPKYYVEVFMQTLFTADNNVTVDFYFYQFLTNRYKPSFVEMHFKFCDMLKSDTIFGQAMQRALGGRNCPFPPGEYDLKNLSIPYVPKNFPFTKGRIYSNTSRNIGGINKQILYASIGLEIKTARINKH